MLGNICPTCKGGVMIVLGLVTFVNGNFRFVDWWVIIGASFLTSGLLLIFFPICGHIEVKKGKPGK